MVLTSSPISEVSPQTELENTLEGKQTASPEISTATTPSAESNRSRTLTISVILMVLVVSSVLIAGAWHQLQPRDSSSNVVPQSAPLDLAATALPSSHPISQQGSYCTAEWLHTNYYKYNYEQTILYKSETTTDPTQQLQTYVLVHNDTIYQWHVGDIPGVSAETFLELYPPVQYSMAEAEAINLLKVYNSASITWECQPWMVEPAVLSVPTLPFTTIQEQMTELQQQSIDSLKSACQFCGQQQHSSIYDCFKQQVQLGSLFTGHVSEEVINDLYNQYCK